MRQHWSRRHLSERRFLCSRPPIQGRVRLRESAYEMDGMVVHPWFGAGDNKHSRLRAIPWLSVYTPSLVECRYWRRPIHGKPENRQEHVGNESIT